MKRILTLIVCAISLNAFGQVPNYLPYNPDFDGDSWIGITDILNLLTFYDAEWQNGELILSSDSTLALIHAGNLFEHECIHACSVFEGNWRTASKSDLLLNAPDLASFYGTELILEASSASSSTGIWWRESDSSLQPTHLQGWFHPDGSSFGLGGKPFGNNQVWIDGAYQSQPQYQSLECWCATQERPKVEFHKVDAGPIVEWEEFLNSKASDGWYVLPQPIPATDTQTVTFWRWAD